MPGVELCTCTAEPAIRFNTLYIIQLWLACTLWLNGMQYMVQVVSLAE